MSRQTKLLQGILLVLIFVFNISAQTSTKKLIKDFKNPPKEYSIIPLWSWNGTMEPEELKRQVDLMLEKGVYGAFMHARAGIEKGDTPYFSDGWWEAIESTVEYSAEKDFLACLYDEDKWPSGSAGGRTVARNPKEFVKKGLRYQIDKINGPAEYEVKIPDALKIFAVKLWGNEQFGTKSQTELSLKKGEKWQVPEGEWAILTFSVFEDPDKQIDYLDKNAVAAFIDITHEEYWKRCGKYFGTTIPGVFFDEIYFPPRGGNVLPWTDDFAEEFQARKGYDILQNLPSLVLKSENTGRTNYDFLDELAGRYYTAWYETYAKWCEDHNIWMTGHTEEYLDAYKRQADYFKTIGRLTIPSTDNEDFRYGYPRYIETFKLKQVSSAAHLYGRTRTGVEAMGGGGYVITPEEYRYGFARFGVGGLNFFIPHLFHYSITTVESTEDWPPSWFFRNPYWKYFKPLADYGRRISFLNSQGNHVCHVALLTPLTDQWIAGYNGEVDLHTFVEAQELLLNNQIDYDLIDPTSLVNSACSGGRLQVQKEAYKVLVLPDLKKVTEPMADKISEFVEYGGVVVALSRIPEIFECEDIATKDQFHQLFGFDPRFAPWGYRFVDEQTFKPYTENRNEQGGVACYSKYLAQLPEIVAQNIPAELQIVSGPHSILRFIQRRQDETNIYLLMNESKLAASWHLSFPNYGQPGILDIETGESQPLENFLIKKNQTFEVYRPDSSTLRISSDRFRKPRRSPETRLETVLNLAPWQAVFLVFDASQKAEKKAMILSSNLEDVSFETEDEKGEISGWVESGAQLQATVLSANGAENAVSWKNPNSLKSIALDGEWNFMPVGHQLDDVWTDKVASDTLELPIMKFFADFEASEKDFAASDFDNAHWPTIKIADKFNLQKGGERILSPWNCLQITSFDREGHFRSLGNEDAVFIKKLDLKGAVEKAELVVYAEPSFKLFINEKEVGAGEGKKKGVAFDVAAFLKGGANEIRVAVPRNKGLLVQGEIQTSEATIPVVSNDSWLVEVDRGFENAFEVAKPPLGNFGELEFTGRKIEFPVTGWYRQQLPVGAKKILISRNAGDFTYFLNGNQVEPVGREIEVTSSQAVLAVKCQFRKKSDGLQAPLKIVFSAEPVKLASWEKYGLGWHSGRGTYTKEFNLDKNYVKAGVKLRLDLGQVNWFAELWVNHKLVKYFTWGDFSTDISRFVQPGKNTVSVIVSNLRANEAYWNVPDESLTDSRHRWFHQGATDREKDRLTSGLLGPVQIVPLQRVEKTVVLE